MRIQIFPGTLDPDSDMHPIPPPKPRVDGLVGFVTNKQGQVNLDLPPGPYTVVASADPDFEEIGRSFLIAREVNVPGEVILSLADTIPVTVSAVGEGDFGVFSRPLLGGFVYFRPSKGTRGLVGKINNDGQLQTVISPGRYHVIISSSIESHYIVLTDQLITPPSTTISFNGTVDPTVELDLLLPPTTQIWLQEVLGTNRSEEFVDVVENIVGYDAAYTEVFSLGLGTAPAKKMRFLPDLTYRFSISYVVELDKVFYAYELRINELKIDEPRTYLIGNNGDQPFTLRAHTDQSEYQPGQPVTVEFEIIDTRGNQLYRFFNFSGARLIFPFVVVRDPNGVVVGSNPVTNDLPEEFFRFEFRLPPTAQPGEYTVDVSLDAKMYGRLTDRFTFRVASARDATPPKISEINAPTTAEANAPIQITAKIEDESALGKVSLELPGKTLIASALPENVYEWNIPASDVGSESELRWQIIAIDAAGNQTTESGEISLRDTTPPTIEHTPIPVAEIGVPLSISAKVSDNVEVSKVIVSYSNESSEGQLADQRVTPSTSRFMIPSTVLTGNSFQYFLQASDIAGNTRRLPETDTFTIQLRDTTPPQMYHAPMTESPNLPIPIEAVVIDNHEVDRVELSYRAIGAPQFTKIVMTHRDGTAAYIATIPTANAEYFLEAVDPSSNHARLPTQTGETYRIRSDYGDEFQLLIIVDGRAESSEVNPISIPVASEHRFQLQAIAANGQAIPVTPIWSVTNGIGEIDQDGRFFAEVRADRIGQVIATIPVLDQLSAARQAIAWVQLMPSNADRLLISPSQTPLLLAAGTQQPFRAIVLDAYGNRRADGVIWDVEGGIGEMVGETFRAQTIGDGRIFATVGELQASTAITVSFGKLVDVEINPEVLEMRAGEQQELSAFGRDTSGNRVAIAPIWSVRGGVGSIRNSTFIAGHTGEGEIVAAIGNLSATASIQVGPGELASITTNPFIAYLPASDDKFEYTHQFVAAGRDVANNPVPIRDLQWTVDVAAGKIGATGLMTSINEANAQILGNIVINGTVWANGKSATGKNVSNKSIVVIQSAPPGPIQSLEVTLNNFDQVLDGFTLAVGESQKFEAVGVDESNQRVQVFPEWAIVGDVGVIQPNGLFIAMQPGDGHLIATDQGFTGRLPIAVTPGVLDLLTIHPAYLTLTTGESHQLRLSGADASGNPLPTDQHRPIWTIKTSSSINTPAVVNPEGFLTAIHSGTAQIEARIGNLTAQAQLFVYPRTRPPTDSPILQFPTFLSSTSNFQFIEVYPNPLEIESGRTQQFRAFVRDETGKRTELTGAEWHVTNGLGSIDSQGVFRPENSGIGHIIATFDGRVGRAYVTIAEDRTGNVPQELIIVPQEAITLTVGDTQSFYTLGVFGSPPSEGGGSGERLRPTLASWRVSDGIGTIDAMGRFIAVTPGAGEVRATVNGVSVTCPVVVQPDSSRAKIISILSAQPPILEELPDFGRSPSPEAIDNRGEAIEFRVTPETIKVRAGNSVRLTAFAFDSAGNLSDVRPNWQLTSNGNIGRIQPNGLFIANRVGSGRILARLMEQDLPSQQISVEVIASRPFFARLNPSEIVVEGNATEVIPLELIAFDQRGNSVSLPNELVTWKVVGDVGTISPLATEGEAIFNVFQPGPRDRIGEVIATIPNINLVGRARILRYAATEGIVSARIEPDEIELPIDSSYQFQWKTQDVKGRLIESQPSWQVFNADTGTPLGFIGADGTLIIGDTLSPGTTLQVIGTLSSPAIRAEAFVHVVAAPLDRIELENITGKSVIAIGESLRFRARGFDRNGNPVDFGGDLPLRWSINPPSIGNIAGVESSVAVLTAVRSGSGEIQVNQSGLSGTATFTVLPGPSTAELRIEVNKSTTPISGTGTQGNPVVVKAGTQMSLIALSADEIVQPTWTGQISADGILVAARVGTVTVTAMHDDISTQFFIRITPGDLAMLRVQPSIVSVLSDPRNPAASTPFSVDAFDFYGNALPSDLFEPPRWSVTGGIGLINESGVFTAASVSAGTAIAGTVVASSEGIYGSASVTVISEIGELETLELIPSLHAVAADASIELQVIGRDDKGNPLPTIDTPIVVRLTPNVGNIDGEGDRWRYHAPMNLPDESNRVFRMRAETLSGASIVSPEIEITLVPAALATLGLDPNAVTIRAGDSQEFRLKAADAFGNAINLKTLTAAPIWSLSEPLGEIVTDTDSLETALFTAKQVGTTHLTARASGIEASAEIQITPGELVSLQISPDSVVLSAGETIEFRLIGLDAHGNRMEDVEATWRVVGLSDSGKLEAQNHRRLWTPETMGTGLIEARWTDAKTGKSLTAQASVQVIAGKLVSLNIELRETQLSLTRLSPPYVLISGGKYNLKANGRDGFGNIVDVQPTWHLAGNLGRITTNGGETDMSALLEAIFVGEGSLIASVEEIQRTENITIQPTTAIIGAGGGRIDSLAGVIIDIPKDALSNNQQIEISIIESPGPSLSARRVTRVIDIQPRKHILNRTAQLTLSYADAIIEEVDSNQLSLYFWDDFQEKWIQISSRVDARVQTVTANVNHFAAYTIMASDQIVPRSDKLRIDGIRLNPPVFYSPETNRLTIEYLLNAPDAGEAEVTIEIFDFRDQRVRTLLERATRRIGPNAEQWDGRTERAETVRNGRYVLVIIAEAGGETVAARKLLVVFK